MNPLTLETPRLRLVLQTPQQLRAFLSELTPDVRAQLSPAWIARAEAATEPDPWFHLFDVLLSESGVKVGQCGFKGPPDASGAVEIAYSIETEHQGKGLATEAAAGLIAFAARTSGIRLVRAHTLRCDDASPRVLQKCGFHLIGPVVDPEDGPVYRWERSLV